jgi:hypothetical protein
MVSADRGSASISITNPAVVAEEHRAESGSPQKSTEIGATLAEPVHERMLDRDNIHASGPQDAEEFGERSATVVDIVNGQRTVQRSSAPPG